MKRTTPVIPAGDIRRQKEYCAELRTLNAQKSPPPLAYVDTYGCQQNEADSELLRGMLADMGYQITDTDQGADVIVINTCAIREHAEQRVFGNVGALVHGKRKKPDQIICLCGCMAQEAHPVAVSGVPAPGVPAPGPGVRDGARPRRHRRGPACPPFRQAEGVGIHHVRLQ